jgi:hypothetical protein
MNYAQQLRDPRWQRRRLEMLNAAEWKCQECLDGFQTLHVHHKIYHKNAAPWDYGDHELIVLCEFCHEGRHQWKSKLQLAIGELEQSELERLLGYAQTIAVFGRRSPASTKIRLEGIEHAAGVSDALMPSGHGRADEVVELRDRQDECVTAEQLLQLYRRRDPRDRGSS